MPIPASYLFRSRRSVSLALSLARFTPLLSATRSTMKIVQSRLLGPLLSILSIRFSSSLTLGGKAQAVVASSPLPAQRSAEPVLPEEKLKDEEFVWPAHQDSDYACSSIFCYNPLLQKTLEVGIKRDWRSMKLKKSSDEARREFDDLMRRTMENPSRRDMEVYTAQNFEAADDIFEPSKPVDWTPNPQTLMQLRDGGIRSFALELNGIWPDLTKQTAKYVEQMPDRYAYIYVPNNHIVPGGNFTSFYYWDSYWIGKGLLASGMNETAKGLLENFLSMVQRYGFVPNGGMVCYERRSQPPFLIPMVYDYVEATGDLEFVKDHIRTLDAEFSFWLKDRAMLLDIDGTSRRVLHYDGQAGNPRPERMKQDIFAGAMWTSSEDKKRFYRAVKSACESGWDFSSRWIIHNGTNVGNVSYTAATSIIPVDLQAFMVKNSLIMAKFHEQLGEEPQKQFYLDFHAEMCHNISVVFWNPETQMWGDYDSINMKRRPYYYLSNIAPLWAGCSGPNMTLDETAEAVVEYLRRNGALDYPGGVPVSTELTGEQWDFPNAWVPLTHLLYEALLQTNSKIAHEVAFSVANKTIKAGYEGYVKYGAMFEKYDVTNLGEPGGGGEYIVQKGFGWTNGAILDMIMRTNGSLQLQPMMKPTPTTGHAAPMLETAAARFSSSKAANFMAVAFLMAFAVGLSVWTTWKVMTKKTSALSWDDYDGIGKKYKRNSRDETELARLQSDTDETSDGI